MMEDIISLRQAADLAKVHPNTIGSWTNSGLLPFRKMGGKRFLLKSDLEKLIQES